MKAENNYTIHPQISANTDNLKSTAEMLSNLLNVLAIILLVGGAVLGFVFGTTFTDRYDDFNAGTMIATWVSGALAALLCKALSVILALLAEIVQQTYSCGTQHNIADDTPTQTDTKIKFQPVVFEQDFNTNVTIKDAKGSVFWSGALGTMGTIVTLHIKQPIEVIIDFGQLVPPIQQTIYPGKNYVCVDNGILQNTNYALCEVDTLIDNS